MLSVWKQYRILKCFELVMDEVGRVSSVYSAAELGSAFTNWWMQHVTIDKEKCQLWNRARETKGPMMEEGAWKEKAKESVKRHKPTD
jgi:hypothetical protein